MDKNLKKLIDFSKSEYSLNNPILMFTDFSSVFADLSLKNDNQFWEEVMKNFVTKSFYFRNSGQLYYTLCSFVLTKVGGRSPYTPTKLINEDLLIGAVNALAKIDGVFCKALRQRLVEASYFNHSASDPKKSVTFINNTIDFIDKLNNPKVIKNDKHLFQLIINKSTSSHLSAQFVLDNSSLFSEDEKSLFLKKIEKLILHRKANRENAKTLSSALKYDMVKSWIVDNLTTPMVLNLNKFISKLTPKDYSIKNFALVNFYKEINDKVGANENVLLQIQKSYIDYTASMHTTYAKRIINLLTIEGTSPKQALYQLSNMGVEIAFLVKEYPELAKLVAIL